MLHILSSYKWLHRTVFMFLAINYSHWLYFTNKKTALKTLSNLVWLDSFFIKQLI